MIFTEIFDLSSFQLWQSFKGASILNMNVDFDTQNLHPFLAMASA